MTTRERIRGALLAHAAGDALGAPLEFLTADAIDAHYGTLRDIVGGGLFGWRPGQGTDDTDLSLIALESLVTCGTYNRADVARRLIDWFNTDPVDVGVTTSQAITNLINGVEPSGISDPDAAGNGSLMRALAPGLACTNPSQRHRYADELSAITHAAADCRAACIAYAEIVDRLVAGSDVDTAIAAAQQLDILTTNVADALTTHTLDDLDAQLDGWVIHSLAVAVGALRDSDRDGLEETLIVVANRGGDADTNAAIAGGLLGAAHTAAAIPQRWLNTLEQRHRIDALVDPINALRGQ